MTREIDSNHYIIYLYQHFGGNWVNREKDIHKYNNVMYI